MRRNIDIDVIVWNTLKVLADDMGYSTRQALINTLFGNFIDMYPNAKLRAIDMSTEMVDMGVTKENYKVYQSISKLSESGMRDLAGDDLYESLTTPEPLNKDQINTARLMDGEITAEEAVDERMEESPELPEL